MKSAFSGLLAVGKQALAVWSVPASLQAANHDDPLSGLRDQRGAPSRLDPAAAATAAAGLPPSTVASAPTTASGGAELPRPLAGPGAEQTAEPTQDHGPDHDPDHDHAHDHAHGGGVCAGLLSERAWLAAGGSASGLGSGGAVSLGTPLVALDQTFRLHSNPGASRTIYLDFDGHTTTGTAWNDSTMGSSFLSPAYSSDSDATSFSSSELTTIQRAWQRVAADFSCFDVNVTTQAPPSDWLVKSGSGDANHGMRVVVTSYGPSSSTAGGIAYINSFNWGSDTPCFVYNTSLVGVSEAISHEVGHSLGLSHDGSATASYYQGHGSGETGWAPIMGVGYYKNVTSWDNGTYSGSNNGGSSANYGKGPDDLAIITGANGFGYQVDQEGNGLDTATALTITAGSVSQFGTIETAADQDWFRFDLGAVGSLELTINPYVYSGFVDSDDSWGGSLSAWTAAVSDASTTTSWVENGSNLDVSVQLLNASGTILASSNPSGLAASLTASGLAAGTYYLRLDGVGFGDPTASSPSGYSDYASIGDYLISGTISGSGTPVSLPVVSLAVAAGSVAEDGSDTLLFSFSRTGDTGAALDVSVSVGGSASAGSDYSGLPGSGSSQTIRFAAGSASAVLSLDPTADTSVEGDETVTLELLSGSGYSLGNSTTASGTIRNDDIAPQTVFTASRDQLTGLGASADTFQLNQLADGLISGGGSFSCDRITNLEAGLDRIDTPSTRTKALRPKQLGSIKELNATAIGTVLNAKGAFARNGASTFTYNDPVAGNRTFLALNNGTTAFNAATDAIVEITGYSGSLGSLAVF